MQKSDLFSFVTAPVCTGWVLVTGVLCCSGREDQRVCGFEVLRGGRDGKQQRIGGGGDQQQREPDRPDVSKRAGVDEKFRIKTGICFL